MNRRDEIVLSKILMYCHQIKQTHSYFQNDRALFFRDDSGFIYRNSIAMPILQIGELAKQLSADFRERHRVIPWRAITGMRDIFAHQYGSVDYEELWKTSHEDINSLQFYLEKAD